MGRDDELRAGVEGCLGLECVHDRPATDHDVAVVLFAKIRQGVETAGRRHRELGDLEAAVDRGSHCLWCRLLRRRPQHRTRSMLREPLEDGIVGRCAMESPRRLHTDADTMHNRAIDAPWVWA